MNTTTPREILIVAAKRLRDETNHDFTIEELTDGLRFSLAAVSALKPNAFTFQERVKLSEGTIHDIPAHCTLMVRPLRNAGQDGTKPGAAITWFDVEAMNRADPNWHTRRQSHVVRQIGYDLMDPRHFLTYPPQQFPPHYIEAVFNGIPEIDDEDLDKPFGVDSSYVGALVDGTMGEALKRGTGKADEAPDLERAGKYLSSFANAIKAMSEAEVATDERRRT